jgi:acetyl esterase/lipase
VPSKEFRGVTTAGRGTKTRHRLRAGFLLFAAAVGVGWLLRNRRQRVDAPSLVGRVMSFWVRALYRPLVDRGPSLDVQRLRRAIDRGRFIRPPAGVTVQAASADEVKVEWLVPERRLAGRHLLYLHGGGFLMGGLGSHRHWVASLARALQAKALHLEYRVAPEHPYPASLDDCVATYRWLLDSGVVWMGIVRRDVNQQDEKRH